MKSILTKTGKISAIFACVLLLVVSATAQLSLRNAVDTDKDNKADFSVFRPSNGVWYILKSGGGFTFQQFGVGDDDTMTPGDYDGDGKGDISVWRDSNGVWYRLNSSDNTFTAIQFGTTNDEPVARDYDGDGKTDLAVVRRTGTNMIWYQLRSTGGFSGVQFGLASDYVAPGDYDGDKKFDIAVQRPGATANAQSIFYILKSLDNSVQSTPWGISNDLVVPGDYDGDQKTDIAVVREGPTPESSLVWYILKSSDNRLLAHAFGATGTDQLAQNDYDGDGKTDVAVWRDTNGTFYALRSSDNGLTSVQWGLPSDLPIAGYDTH
jgi:hypothetical protein